MSLIKREIEPIKSKRTKEIKKKKYLYRINANGYPVLKNKQIALKNHHYNLVKLPPYHESYSSWKKALKEDKRFNENFLEGFLSPAKEIKLKDIYIDLFFDYEPLLPKKSFFLAKKEEDINKMVKDSLAVSLFKNEKINLKNFCFTRLYTSPNNQYFFDKANIGIIIDAWGMREGTTTLVEIKSLLDFDFERLKKAKIEGTLEKFLALHIPVAFYTLQMKLFCTGLNYGVLFLVNQNTFETLAFLVQKDKVSFDWFFKLDKEHKKILSFLEKTKSEKEAFEFLDNYFNTLLFKESIEPPYEREKDSFLSSLELKNKKQIEQKNQ